MIQAGKRDKWITIQLTPEVTSAGGEVTEGDPITVCRVWAAIEPLSARETWAAMESQSLASHRITIPYVSGITSRMRALWRGRTFHFESVLNTEESNRELVITATEEVE